MKQKDGEIYGVLPFIAPEVLNRKQPTTESDVYSFGMIMWEILHVKSVICYYKLDDILGQTIKILDGFRPPISDEAPQCYVKLMRRCWDKDPKNRPFADEHCKVFKQWQDDQEILSELNKFEPFRLLQYYIHLIKSFSNEDADDLSTETDLSGFLETNPDYEQILSELNESNLIIPDFKEKSNENIFGRSRLISASSNLTNLTINSLNLKNNPRLYQFIY